jgi:hypothetical protein
MEGRGGWPAQKAGPSALTGKLSPSKTRAKRSFAKDRERSQVQESNGLFPPGEMGRAGTYNYASSD